MRRQRKSRGAARTKAKAYYRANKSRIKARAKSWRKRNKSRIKMTRRRYSRNPSAFRRIAADLPQDLSQEIVFSFGKDETPGIVLNITDTGVVEFDLDDEFEGEHPFCLPLDVFTDLAVFDSPDDTELFFSWVDTVLGGEEYEQYDRFEDQEIEEIEEI
jgi:hypothetical protein